MKSLSLTFFVFLLLATTLHAEPRKYYPVTSQQIAHALVLRNLDITSDQIALVANIVAATSEPSFTVDSVQPLDATGKGLQLRARIKLSCSDSSICLPFYAIFTGSSAVSSRMLSVLGQGAAGPASPALIAMHAGTHATLTVDTAQMHICLPVISLQNGSIGSRIRVTSSDRKQIYSATITGSTSLKGSL